ncbi:prophage DinI [Salmonella enterica subsp. enterica serovar Typhimurium str. 14028S]|uniref:Prophage DinI n=1 Tax=Salmonella typhimurium (strain 14028s / SGSC 2262) TaxID=588858 RepID=A0A0F6B547_SALT1|nr:prophage DinI [Salmonella enterica subsp. enterica serovar Typhimurium str. 14028S]
MSYQLSSDFCKAELLNFCSPFRRCTDAVKNCRQQHQRDTQIAVF